MGESGVRSILTAGNAVALAFEEEAWLRDSLHVRWDPFGPVPWQHAALSGPDHGKCSNCGCSFANKGLRARGHFDLCVRGVAGCG